MNSDQAIELARQTLEITLLICGPMLVIAMGVGLVVSIFQVVTSVQDTTVSTVPRLTAVGVIVFLLTPWMLHHLVAFTRLLFSDFRLYTQ